MRYTNRRLLYFTLLYQQTDTTTDIHEDHFNLSVTAGYYHHTNAATWPNDILLFDNIAIYVS